MMEHETHKRGAKFTQAYPDRDSAYDAMLSLRWHAVAAADDLPRSRWRVSYALEQQEDGSFLVTLDINDATPGYPRPDHGEPARQAMMRRLSAAGIPHRPKQKTGGNG